MTPPRRYKTPEELSTAEHHQIISAERRGGEAPRFETDDYRAYRADALRDAGLDEEADESDPKALDEMSAAEHFEHLRRN
jgi:hypothetical protein